MKTTLQEKIVAGLLSEKSSVALDEVPSKTHKARTIKRLTGGFFFIGKNGSLRIGNCYSKSRKVSTRLKELIIERGAEELK